MAEAVDRNRIASIFARQKVRALALRESTAEERVARLQRLRQAVEDREAALCEAARDDFRKPESEVRLTELLPVYGEIRQATKNLVRWMRPRRVPGTLALWGTRAELRSEPRGVCLIVAPWNYPFQLCIGPLVSAIAAGNTAVIKPSEMTPRVSALVRELVQSTFPEDEVAVFEGDESTATALLEQPFDHLFFTGSPAVGRIVMAAAARHLATVTLELGGKSPAIVDASADPGAAARHLVWGKFTNNGQTCIAPDHLYVHEEVLGPFLECARQAIARCYGDNPERVRESGDYARIVNARHFQRVLALYEDARQKGARTFIGGDHDSETRFFAPTILTDVPDSARLMEEEIFGPLLPVLPFTDLKRVTAAINERPKPLALYVFGRDRARIDSVLDTTSAGGVCVNHNLLQYAHDHLPFGGVNESGIGRAHGRYGFEAFSHQKPVLVNRFSLMHLLYPPYTRRKRRLIDWVVRKLG